MSSVPNNNNNTHPNNITIHNNNTQDDGEEGASVQQLPTTTAVTNRNPNNKNNNNNGTNGSPSNPTPTTTTKITTSRRHQSSEQQQLLTNSTSNAGTEKRNGSNTTPTTTTTPKNSLWARSNISRGLLQGVSKTVVAQSPVVPVAATATTTTPSSSSSSSSSSSIFTITTGSGSSDKKSRSTNRNSVQQQQQQQQQLVSLSRSKQGIAAAAGAAPSNVIMERTPPSSSSVSLSFASASVSSPPTAVTVARGRNSSSSGASKTKTATATSTSTTIFSKSATATPTITMTAATATAPPPTSSKTTSTARSSKQQQQQRPSLPVVVTTAGSSMMMMSKQTSSPSQSTTTPLTSSSSSARMSLLTTTTTTTGPTTKTPITTPLTTITTMKSPRANSTPTTTTTKYSIPNNNNKNNINPTTKTTPKSLLSVAIPSPIQQVQLQQSFTSFTKSNVSSNSTTPTTTTTSITERLYNSPTHSSSQKKQQQSQSQRQSQQQGLVAVVAGSSPPKSSKSSSSSPLHRSATTTTADTRTPGRLAVRNKNGSRNSSSTSTSPSRKIFPPPPTTTTTTTATRLLLSSRDDNHYTNQQQQHCSCSTTSICTCCSNRGNNGNNCNAYCNCTEELCQCNAYQIIQSVQTFTTVPTKRSNKKQRTTTTTTTTIRPSKNKNLTPTTTNITSLTLDHDNDPLLFIPQQQQRQNNSHDTKWKLELLVNGMTCSMCSQAVDTAIRRALVSLFGGVDSDSIQIDISLTTDIVIVEWVEKDPNNRLVNVQQQTATRMSDCIETLRTAITSIGYNVQDIQVLQHPMLTVGNVNDQIEEGQNRNNDNSSNNNRSVEDRWDRYRQRQIDKVSNRKCAFLLAVVFIIPIFILTMIVPYITTVHDWIHHKKIVLPYLHISMPYDDFLLWIFATPIQFVCGYEFYKMAFYSFCSGKAGMDVLVAIGTTASYLYALQGIILNTTTPNSNKDHLYDTSHFFETSATLIVFVLAGKWMQAAAVRRTSDAITQLMSLQSPTAIRVTPTQQHAQSTNDRTNTNAFNPLVDPYIEEITDVQNVMVGDMIKVIRGSSIPVDGCVLFGEIVVDESMMTGESVPIHKMKGSIVLGGTICVDSGNSNIPGGECNSGSNVGAAFIRVTGVGSSSALAKIVDLVQQAQSRTVPIQSIADQISAIFVPTVCIISLLTYLVWYALCSSNVVPVEWYRDELGEDSVTFSMMFAIACLVISCPCALGLATPTAIMVGTGVGAKCGILMKGGSALEVASKVNTVVFDKTGTLTKGVPSICNVIRLSNFEALEMSETTVLWLVGSLERTSEHPLAKAVVKFVEQQLGDTVLQADPFRHPTDFQSMTGRGARGTIDNKISVAVGNRSFAAVTGLKITDEADAQMQLLEEAGKTSIFVAIDQQICVVLGIVDELKDDAAASISYLTNKMGVDVWMVTGDNARTAKSISERVGIPTNRVISEALPITKLEKIRELQHLGDVVCMVGDGVNDSAALAQADVGMGMGTGTDIATEASDMILIRANVRDVCTALHLSRVLFRRIQLNFLFSLLYNCLGIPIAVGICYPWIRLRLPPTVAAVAMVLSSTSVVLSSLTLRFYRPPNVFSCDTRNDIVPSLTNTNMPTNLVRPNRLITNIDNSIDTEMGLSLLANDHLATAESPAEEAIVRTL